MKEDKKRSKKWLVLLFLLFLFLVFYFLFRFYFSKPGLNKNISTVKLSTKPSVSISNPSEPEKIIKCQTVVVTPKVTTELFTYVSGNKVRADYRIGANTEEGSFKTQIFYDGAQVHMWKPPAYYGGPKPENPRGIKMKIPEFKYNINLTELDKVERFGNSPVSGDHLCSEWDGVDSVFEVPSDFELDETTDAQTKIEEELNKICKICEGAGTDDIKTACQKNLVCE